MIVNHLGVTVKERGEFAADPVIGATGLRRMFAGRASSRGSTEHQHVQPSVSYSLSNALPTVGQEARPEVVSDSPHLQETHRSEMGHSTFWRAEAYCTNSFALREARAMVSIWPCCSMRECPDKQATGLPGLGNAVHHVLGPLFFDADNDDGGNVRGAPGADIEVPAEVEVKVGTELQTAECKECRGWQRCRRCYWQRRCKRAGKGRPGAKSAHMIADAHAAVVAAITGT